MARLGTNSDFVKSQSLEMSPLSDQKAGFTATVGGPNAEKCGPGVKVTGPLGDLFLTLGASAQRRGSLRRSGL